MNDLIPPPHNIDAEQAVIGAVLNNAESLHDLELASGDFYRKQHQVIWGMLRVMQDQRKAVDVLTLKDALDQAGALGDAGGIEYLADLALHAHSSANVRHYAAIVAERALERRLISAGHKIADMGYNAEGRTAAERASLASGLLTDLESRESDEPVTVSECFREMLDELQRRLDRKGDMLGLPTGFDVVDKRTSGLMPGNLVVIAGRPAMGKSTFAFNIAEHNAMQGQLVIVYSLEMSREEIMLKMTASTCRVPLKELRTATLENHHWDKVAALGGRLKGLPMFIADNPVLTSEQVLSRSRRISRKMGKPPALIVVDYLQLLSDKGDNLNERTAKISRNLKLTAKELGCPVIALSQLNRKVDDRSDKRPLMSDLRDSGAVEQDADLIFMLYRDEVYNEHSNRKGIAEVLCRKFRNGQTGDDFLAANLHMSRFDNLAHGYTVPPEQRRKESGGFSYGE